MLSDHDCRDPDAWDERPSVPKRIIALTSGFLERACRRVSAAASVEKHDGQASSSDAQ